MNHFDDSGVIGFTSRQTTDQNLLATMTFDCNRQQQHNGYAMQGLTMLDSNSVYVDGDHTPLDMYANDYHGFHSDGLDSSISYYGASNSDLMLSYDGVNGPGPSIGHYYTSVDPMVMTQQPHQYGANGLDYTDVNNLEPSLMPDQVDGIQEKHINNLHQMHNQHSSVQYSNGIGPNISNGIHQRMPQPNMAAYAVANYYNGSYHSSPTGSSHASSATDISDEGDDMFGLSAFKRSPTGEMDYRTMKGKRQGKKRKPRKDPNEPQKPVSAYALFFRDTQAAIKGQNPNASFGEVSKIVASMWDSLGSDQKNVYKQKTESAKKEYLKQLAAYRANLLSKGNRGCMTVDPYAELAAQQRKASVQTQAVSSPDSTTSTGADQRDPCTEIGTKTLASLIAEPAPQQVLTATTTLTVPQSYTSARNKGDYSLDVDSNAGNSLCIRTTNCQQKSTMDEQPRWDREYCNDDVVSKNCRDLYNGWIPVRQQQSASTFAPV